MAFSLGDEQMGACKAQMTAAIDGVINQTGIKHAGRFYDDLRNNALINLSMLDRIKTFHTMGKAADAHRVQQYLEEHAALVPKPVAAHMAQAAQEIHDTVEFPLLSSGQKDGEGRSPGAAAQAVWVQKFATEKMSYTEVNEALKLNCRQAACAMALRYLDALGQWRMAAPPGEQSQMSV